MTIKKCKEYGKLFAIFTLAAGLLAGCFRVDYAVFKSKYPNAGVFDYIWSGGNRR